MKTDVCVIFTLMLFSSSGAASDCLRHEHVIKMASWELDCYRETCYGVAKSDFQTHIHKDAWTEFQEDNCFCDEKCMTYSDCCRDKTEVTTAHVLPRDSYTCHVVNGLYSSGLPIYIVHKCPDDWVDNLIRDNCEITATEDPGIFLNLFVSDSDRILYRNMYCALCHGVKDVTYWRLRVACDMVVHLEGDLQSPDFARNLKERLQENVCHVKYDTPVDDNKKQFIRLCKPMISECAANWTDPCIRDLCEGTGSVAAFVYSKSSFIAYRNKFCALCNYAGDITCYDVITELLFTPTIGIMGDRQFYPLNIIFDINPGGGPTAEYRVGQESGVIVNKTITELKTCPVQHVYDPFIGECRLVMCRSGYVFVHGQCQRSLTANSTVDTCMVIILNRTEYTLLEDGVIYVNASGTLHGAAEYESLDGERLAMCTNFSQNFTETSGAQPIMKFSQAQGIVSVIGQIISLVALALTMVVYAMLPKLHNLAGKCTMCLSASLFAAQFLFLVGVSFHAIDHEKCFGACAFFAVITFLAFLCSFFWMNVMAFDICRIFTTSVRKTSKEGLKRRFYRYSGYAWSSAVAITLITIIVEYGAPKTSEFLPGFGYGLCWFTNRKALFLFFAFPVAVIITANTILYVITAVHICKVQKDTEKIMKNNKHRYKIYVKLSVIMGMTWIFAFIATGTDSEVVWYFFLILNTLQGAFIFFAFVLTHQVKDMLREKYHKAQEALRSRSGSSAEKHTMSTTTSRLSSASAW